MMKAAFTRGCQRNWVSGMMMMDLLMEAAESVRVQSFAVWCQIHGEVTGQMWNIWAMNKKIKVKTNIHEKISDKKSDFLGGGGGLEES